MIHDKKYKFNSTNRNFSIQYYRGIPLQQIDRRYGKQRARRFTINQTNQNLWIPMKHLYPDGTIIKGHDIDYALFQSKRQLEIAGIDIIFSNREERLQKINQIRHKLNQYEADKPKIKAYDEMSKTLKSFDDTHPEAAIKALLEIVQNTSKKEE